MCESAFRDLSRESSCCGRFGEAINLLSPAGMEPQFVGCPASSPVACTDCGIPTPHMFVCTSQVVTERSANNKEMNCNFEIYFFAVSGTTDLTHHSSEYGGFTGWAAFLDMKNLVFCKQIVFVVSSDSHNKW